MNKIIIKTEVEVPEEFPKFEKYALARGALSQAARQLAEEKSHGEINFSSSKGSWELEEVEDE